MVARRDGDPAGELRAAARELRARGMARGARWAAEQLLGLDPAARRGGAGGKAAEGPPGAVEGVGDEEEAALLFFEAKEYRQAAHALEGRRSPVARCLRCHALYLAGERRKEEEEAEAAGALGDGGGTAENKELAGLEAELAGPQGAGDPFLGYLHGLLLVERERKAEAKAALLASVRAFPCNWGAWTALLPLFDAAPDPGALPDHFMARFFLAALCLELQMNERGLEHLEGLARLFPRSDYVKAQTATAHYNLRRFDEAQGLFQELMDRSPYRIEGMDTYSNILYVKEDYAGLSHLAHHAMLTDKYKPETCCIAGNYYSLRMMHEKAVTYFQRALKLNKGYLSAWTLMGHEYVEMKRTEAAIEAYRKAVDINPRDYRAWYGMGQTYELLHMPYYALHYFRQATRLRPKDARFWCAMGQCYQSEQLGMVDKAVECYKNAERQGDREGIALARLAELYERKGDSQRAYEYHSKNLRRLDADGGSHPEVVNALRFLAQHAVAAGLPAEAEGYCTRLLDYGGNHREEAKALLRDLQAHLPPAAAATPSPGGMDMDMSDSEGSPMV